MENLESQLFSKKNEVKRLLSSNKYTEIISLINSICSLSMIEISEYDIYSNVTPYDKKVSEFYGIDYINASFVVSGEDKYIACQNPKDQYKEQFFKFLFTADYQCILSLNTDSNYLNGFKVIKSRTRLYEGVPFIKDDLIEFRNKTIRKITCLQWEDMSTMSYDKMELLYSYMNVYNNDTKIIHCKAGVGRTGTFIMYRALKQYQVVTDDIFIDTFLTLRAQRCHLVTHKKQLEFLHSIFVRNT